jgi:hypothetical protein
VQTFIAKKVLNVLSEKTQHEITLDKVNISWLDRASLNDFLILDKKRDTLIYAKSLLVNYRVWDLLNGEYLNIEEIVSDDLKLHMIKHDTLSSLNLTEFINSLKSGSGTQTAKPLKISFIELNNLDFGLSDKTKTPKIDQVDFANIKMRIPNFEMTDLEVKSDTISGSVLQMQGYEINSGFQIVDFNSVFSLSSHALSIDDLDLVTPTSHITDSLEFFYSGLDDLSSFVDSVSFIFHFKESKISSQDFKLISGLNNLKSDVAIDGIIWGSVGDFNIEEARIEFGSESFFEGGVSCFGLPDVEKVFILADLTNAHIIPSDVEDYTGSISENLKRLGRIDFTGSFAGFLRDFVANGDFTTDLGSVRSDINLKIPDNTSEMSYSGNLELINANIGIFLQNDMVQTVNLKAAINGKGVSSKNANFNLKAVAFQSEIKGYVYDSIKAEGKFASNYFDGTFSVNDPNCQLNGAAQIDFNKEVEVLNVKMVVDSAHVDKLNLSSSPMFVRGFIDVEAKDLDIDHFSGYVNIDSAYVFFNKREIVIDSLRLRALFEDSTRIFRFSVPGIVSELKGDFKISDVIKDLPIVINAYARKLNLTKDTLQSEASESNYKMDFKAEFNGLSKYLDSLKVPLRIPEKAMLEASFRKSKNFNFTFFFNTVYIDFDGNTIFSPSLEINAANDEASENFLTNFIFSSDRQVVNGVPETTDFLLEGIWYDDNIDITTLAKQEATSTNLRIESNIELFPDSIVLKMRPSKVIVFDERWKFNPSNKITFHPNAINVKDLEIFDDSELLSLEGVYSKSIPSSLQISAEDLNMNKASLFSKSKIDGFLNGTFRVFRDDVSESFKLDGGFQMIRLQLDDFLIGNVIGTADWDPFQQSIDTKVEVVRDNFKSIQIKGKYSPLKSNNQLDFDVTFDQADLIMGQPFLVDNFSNIRGIANGSLKITGNVASPEVNGSCAVENGVVTINYLNTDYKFNGKLNFNPNSITFSNFDLTDRKGAQAQVLGYLSHNHFREITTKLQIRADNFEFLNTTSLDNTLYYGSAYGSGTIDISGPFTDLLIKANIRTENNTRFFIPVSESTSVSQEDYISFVDLTDTTKTVEEIKFRGLTLDFDIEVTPDAYCELIFDLKAGDIIRGRGRGNLKLRLDTDGEFHMFGPLEITDGAYNFTMANIISKEFSVIPGSRITWYGDPYSAILDLRATYLQRASFSTLSSTTGSSDATSSSKPLLVILNLNGVMLSPEIEFDIQLQNQADGAGTEESQLAAIRSDEQELRRQVVSLLFLKRFSPKSNFFDQGQQGLNFQGSASEMLSGQLSYLLSQVDENLEIDVDLASLDKEAFNTLQLRLAYTFLDGRLKVTRGGSVGSQDGTDANVLNDIVGDLSVEYSLTKDGKLRAKVFRNTNQSLVSSNERIQETGVSLRFVHSFSDFKELMTLKRSEILIQESIDQLDSMGSMDSIPIQN